MNCASNLLAATLLSAALLFANGAQAMPIVQFDKMSDQDQADYIGDLIVGAERVLTDEGRPDLAAQVKQLFTTKQPGDSDTLGMISFEANLASLRVVDARSAEKNPGAPRFEVEHVMILTLKDNGIVLPKSFMHVGDNFRPKSASALVTRNPDGTFTVRKEPPNGEAKGTKAEKGLVIPAQVVVPFTPTLEKKK